eukprot:gene10701-10777_t
MTDPVRRLLLSAPVAALAWRSGAAEAATASTIEGFSPERLKRIRTLLEKGAAERRFAGAVWRVSRHGRTVNEGAVGFADLESQRPMAMDAIFRIFSMTKPITVATALTYYEEGAFDLHDPVSKYIPEFADVKVQNETKDASGALKLTLTAPTRPLLVIDLMRHTAGLSYAGPKAADGGSLYTQLGVSKTDAPLSEWVKRLASAPLVRDPGTGFDYGYGLDVVGRLIEIWSGKPFDVAMRERVLEPLGMSDTGFWTPASKAGRVTTLYSPSTIAPMLPDGARDIGGPVVRSVFAAQDAWKADPVLKYGGAGLLSTLSDYARFTDMLRNRGAHGGHRILAPSTVGLMSSDLLGAIPAKPTDIWTGYGFGLGVEVSRGPEQAATPLPAGAYDWGGAASTWMWIDPRTDLTGHLMLQVFPSSPRWAQLYKQIVYGALVEPG